MAEALPSLILFARAPVAGRVKTRLSPPLSAEQAAHLYRAFLEDAARAYLDTGRWRPVLAAEPEADDPLLVALFPPPWRREPQGEGDLGARLTAAFRRELSAGAPAALAVGSDHPSLPRRRLADALAALERGADAAVVPAQDGGYCAIALSRRVEPAEVFRDIPWSTPGVLAATLARLTQAGLVVAALAPAYDVDRPEDLERLRRDLAARDPGEEDFPSATAAALAALAERAAR